MDSNAIEAVAGILGIVATVYAIFRLSMPRALLEECERLRIKTDEHLHALEEEGYADQALRKLRYELRRHVYAANTCVRFYSYKVLDLRCIARKVVLDAISERATTPYGQLCIMLHGASGRARTLRNDFSDLFSRILVCINLASGRTGLLMIFVGKPGRGDEYRGQTTAQLLPRWICSSLLL
jgi:hypothetical protein